MTRHERRKAIKNAIEFLKSDLYERDRDYSESSLSLKPVVPIEVDHDRETIWGSPLGWRVLFRVEGDLESDNQRVVTVIYDGSAKEYARCVFTDFDGGYVIETWLNGTLP